jgi:hypothetical protein
MTGTSNPARDCLIEPTTPEGVASNPAKAVCSMGNDDLLGANLDRVLSLTKFHLLRSRGTLEESRLCLAQSQRKIMMSQRVIAKSDALIRALNSDPQPSEETERAR